jgi:molybdopterin converting factor subunit 1
MPRVLPNLHLKVLFFGRIRELIGLAEQSIEMPEGTTLADLFDHYQRRCPSLNGFRGSLVVSRNEEFASWDTPVSPGDEIAFLPPVSGG